MELIGRYNAGGAGLEIGGDWYDAVRRSDGIVHVTVGDVAGHGVTAAVLMGQLRNAFRAHAYEHTSPAELLRRMLRHVDEDEMATALCLTLDPYTQELTYASAGHPPSLLVDGNAAAVSRLAHALAPPLGYVQASAIREATVELPSGATLVAYTDGLVERRGWSIDTGIDLLASVVGSASSLAAAPLADRIFEEVAPQHRLQRRHRAADRPAARGAAAHGHRGAERSGRPGQDPRSRLRTWLELRGLAEDECNDAILAVSEACNNAIEHAYQLDAGAHPACWPSTRGRARHSRRGPRRMASDGAELRTRPRHPADARGHGHGGDRARRPRHARDAQPAAGLSPAPPARGSDDPHDRD